MEDLRNTVAAMQIQAKNNTPGQPIKTARAQAPSRGPTKENEMITHAYPDTSGWTPCCGRHIRELPGEPFTHQAEKVTCGWNNLLQARELVREITELRSVQAHLKQAFAADELDGGWKTALEHPLFLQAEARISQVQSELKELI